MKIKKCINIYSHIWKLAVVIAKLEHRSVSNLIECLIVEEAQKKNIENFNFER